MTCRAFGLLFLFLSAAPSVAQEAATEGDRSEISLPPGVSETDLLRALIPDYDERTQESEVARGTDEAEDHYFFAEVTGVVETDFGWGGKKYLVAAASGSAGMCGMCQFSRAAVLNRSGRKVLFRFPVEERGIGMDADPRVLSVAARKESVVVALKEFQGSQGHWQSASEVWYWPKRGSGGELSFEEIWRGEVSAMSYGNWGSSAFHACGEMSRVKGSWYHVLSTYYGGEMSTEGGEDPLLLSPKDVYSSGWRVGCEKSGIGPIEIRRVQRFTSSGNPMVLRGDPPKYLRIDLRSSDLFPFNLPVRKGAWLRTEMTTSESSALGSRRVTSPDGNLAAEPPSDFPNDNLVIWRAGGTEALRKIRLHHGDAFYGLVRAIGWARDESRVFVVITFGNQHTALLSFSVEGNDDYWEGLIREDETGWTDGFVMELVQGRKQPS